MTKLEYVQQRIQQLRTFLLSNNGIQSVSFNGQSIVYDRVSAAKELLDLEKQEAYLLDQAEPTFKNIDLQSAF